MRDWKTHGFTEDAWEALKESIAKCQFCTKYSNFFGNIYCGALVYDLVLYDTDDDWTLCADAYLLGEDTGYGYTPERNTPYDEGDGFRMDFDVTKSYDETLMSFIEQAERMTNSDRTWTEFADKTDPKWEDEYEEE